MPLELSVTLTTRDVAFSRLFLYFRSGWGFAIAALGIFMSAASVSGYSRGYDTNFFSSVLLPAFAGLVAIPFGVAVGGINSPQLKKLLSGPITYQLFPERLVVSTSWFHTSTPWAELRRAYRAPWAFLISGPGTLHIVPLRVISAAQSRALGNALKAALGPKARFKEHQAA